MSDVRHDFIQAKAAADRERTDAEREGRASYMHDVSCAYMRLALADQDNRGVRLSAEEVTGLLRMDDAISNAAQETCKKLIGHYPGDE